MDYVKYDPTLFLVERKEATSGLLGEFILGESKLGEASVSGEWVEIELASFNYSCDYAPDENGTLIFGSESASVSFSWWENEVDPRRLYPSDLVRVWYDDVEVFYGIVETTNINYEPDPNAPREGPVRKVQFTANLLSYPMLMMATKELSWKTLPAESAYKRITRKGWITKVEDW